MNKRGDLWIIPFLPEEEYHLDVLIGQEHTVGLIDFIHQKKLNLKINQEDYHIGPCLLASLGYMVVKSENQASILIFYLPQVISSYQRDWFLAHRYLGMEYMKIGGYSLKKDWVPIKGFDGIRNEIKEKYIKEDLKAEEKKTL